MELFRVSVLFLLLLLLLFRFSEGSASGSVSLVIGGCDGDDGSCGDDNGRGCEEKWAVAVRWWRWWWL